MIIGDATTGFLVKRLVEPELDALDRHHALSDLGEAETLHELGNGRVVRPVRTLSYTRARFHLLDSPNLRTGA